jgi:pantoate--beta-alanine ligase
LLAALERGGWQAMPVLGRHDDVTTAAEGVDVLVLAVPDGAVADVASSIESVPSTVVVHLAGALGLGVLAPHERRASLHPLRAIPTGDTDLAGGWFAVSGDAVVEAMVESLGGRVVRVADADRLTYHAAAVVASNHVVALLGQVERLASQIGVPLDAFLDLARGSLENVAALGPAAALTGPVARGDWATVHAHLDALPRDERTAYATLAREAAKLASDRESSDMPPRSRPKPVVHEAVASFRAALDAERALGRTVGLVPTMGFLHDGHASLMRRAAEECDVVALTIFVNPTQFGAGEDFESYPRDVERDLATARESGASHVFAPPVEEMYPTAGGLTAVQVREVSEGLEGGSRPTHFAGVATVVTKLFNIAGRCRAYFGEKDWQQLQVVRQLVRDLDMPVDVVGCATVREPDGLAMSSRNVHLSPDERRAATVLSRALLAAQDAHDPVETMKGVVGDELLVDLDYAEVLGDRLLIAATVGRTRLIDNAPATKEPRSDA